MKSNKNDSIPDRCVYGYIGSFNDAIKPLLLVYLIGSIFGTGLLAVLSEDASREFVLSTTLHLLPEMLVWTHLIFPPHPIDRQFTMHNHCGRWGIRAFYAVGFAILLLGPLQKNANGNLVIGPMVVKTYFVLAGISDFLGLWLGMVMMVRKSHIGARRLGVAFFIHSAAFHIHAFEVYCFGDGFGIPLLRGFTWFVLLFATLFGFLGIVPLLRQPMDLRDQQPTRGEKFFIAGGVLTSLLGMPLLAAKASGFRYMPSELLDVVAKNPSFLPRDIRVLAAYKVIVPLLSFVFLAHVLQTYVDARLPILPITSKTSSSSTSNGTNGKSTTHCPVGKSDFLKK